MGTCTTMTPRPLPPVGSLSACLSSASKKRRIFGAMGMITGFAYSRERGEPRHDRHADRATSAASKLSPSGRRALPSAAQNDPRRSPPRRAAGWIVVVRGPIE